MDFPKRTSHHIKETASWKLFQSSIPSHWIIREVTERDYGIDAYIEIVSVNGDVTGDLCSIQLKSSEQIEWKDERAQLAAIKKSTLNYLMNIPVPAFIVWADLSNNELFFSPIKDVVRANYKNLLNENKTMGVPFKKANQFDTKQGVLMFGAHYLREKDFINMNHYLRMLVIHAKDYYNFIIYNQGRDFFLPVEEKSQILMVHIYHLCKKIADYLFLSWDVISISEIFRNEVDKWNDGYALHEYSLTKVLTDLEPAFLKVLASSKELVTIHQKDFWKFSDSLIYSMYDDLNLNSIQSDID